MVTIHNQFSKFSCDPKHGLQWKELSFLKENKEIKNSQWISVVKPFDPSQNFFASGCFIMFPWVNRMFPNSYIAEHFETDGNGYPLHGLIHQNSWELLDHQETHFTFCNRIEINQDHEGKQIERKGKIEIRFELMDRKLLIEGFVYNLSEEKWRIALGFHPYFQLVSLIDSLELEFSLPYKQISLNDKLLPMAKGNKLLYHVLNERTICIENMHFDYLYEMNSGIDVSLWSEFNEVGIRLKDHSLEFIDTEVISFNYLQIYTPEDRKSIALEPMTSPGNLENLPNSTNITLDPGSKKKFKFSISFLSS
ncbi:MAG: aldose 1-epimerase [Leptospira sp.]|nr:aldose 1-epimerase [Leptospira sp.]